MRSGAGAALRSPTDEAARSRCAPLAEQIGARAMVPAIGVAAKAVTTLAMSGPSAEPQPDSARIRPTLIRRVTSIPDQSINRALRHGGQSSASPLACVHRYGANEPRFPPPAVFPRPRSPRLTCLIDAVLWGLAETPTPAEPFDTPGSYFEPVCRSAATRISSSACLLTR